MVRMPGDWTFIFVTCQVGAEAAVKGELGRQWPAFRFAYSRPGFLTFKLPAEPALPGDFDLRSVFARAYGFSLGRVGGESVAELAQAAARLCAGRSFQRLHAWPRDTRPAGHRGYQPGFTPAAGEAAAALREQLRAAAGLELPEPPLARRSETVLDCILLEPGEWWLGWHQARTKVSCWPGGFCPVELPADAVSRAWLKMEEALRWSGLPVRAGERAVEIGCAPGGASQALLQRGLLVTGIDPADVHPAVAAHPHFTHLKKRGADVRRREFRKTRWLVADINQAPAYTLDMVEAIVTHEEVNIRGLILMLKLLDWKLAEHVPEYLARVQSWGYPRVLARQLGANRQEVCLAALRRGTTRR